MSKKLLNESTIRKFMKLANIEPLADGFINEADAGLASQGAVSGKAALGSSTHPDHRNKKAKDAALASQGPGLVKEEELDEDEEVVEEAAYYEEEHEEGMHVAEDMHAEEEHDDFAPADEEPAELPGDEGPADAGVGEGEIEGLVAAIADAIESHTGVAVDVAGDEGAEAADVDLAPPEGEEGGEELPAPEGDEEEVLEDISMIDEESIVNETFNRVKARLSKMQKEEQLLESLTDKIYKRLAQKNKK
mgnify:CR=1 FL=1